MKTSTKISILPRGVEFALRYLQDKINILRDKGWIIALDGHSSSGKSTIARQLAGLIGYLYVDSGAMYRAVTFYLLKNGISIQDKASLLVALDEIVITFDQVGDKVHTFLNGVDVEKEIRKMEVSNHVSAVSTISEVRKLLVRQQREMARETGIVMDGRDIGTVVFPDADIKFFITADLEVRIARRYEELVGAGVDTTRSRVRENIVSRDHTDSTREDSPLRQAEDAIVLDTSDLDTQDQLFKVLEIILNRLDKSEDS